MSRFSTHLLMLPLMHASTFGRTRCLLAPIWQRAYAAVHAEVAQGNSFWDCSNKFCEVGVLQPANILQMSTWTWVYSAGLYDRAVQPGAPNSPEPCPIITVKRLISCPTYCSRLHVNQHMAEHLLPVLPDSASIKVGIAAPSLKSTCC